jgi:RNA polymerase sigma-70 factor, ECF subfamily
LRPEDDFIIQIKANERIIHKVIGLYVFHEEDKKGLYQEILLQAWKSFANFKGISKFSTWLYKVSLHTVLSFKRRDKPVEVFE